MNPIKAIASLPGKAVRSVARKVWAGSAGAGFGVPVAKVALWFLTDPKYGNVQFPPDIAENVALLIEMGVTALVALVAGYATTERELDETPGT